ncbi:unnamed protein product, partial [Pleuronectes platessa]
IRSRRLAVATHALVAGGPQSDGESFSGDFFQARRISVTPTVSPIRSGKPGRRRESQSPVLYEPGGRGNAANYLGALRASGNGQGCCLMLGRPGADEAPRSWAAVPRVVRSEGSAETWGIG